jgi:xanthine/uracil/vitamin C permease (AzgA family)
MGALANLPVGMAPGLSLNSYVSRFLHLPITNIC